MLYVVNRERNIVQYTTLYYFQSHIEIRSQFCSIIMIDLLLKKHSVRSSNNKCNLSYLITVNTVQIYYYILCRLLYQVQVILYGNVTLVCILRFRVLMLYVTFSQPTEFYISHIACLFLTAL